MNDDEKIQVFRNEIKLIKSLIVSEFALAMIADLPDYFFEIPASSTGRYHPRYALGSGGLVRHVRATVILANELFPIHDFTDVERDLIVASLLGHDGRKRGDPDSGHTVHNHPLLQVRALRSNPNLSTSLPSEQFKFVCDCISAHMGQWNHGRSADDEVLSLPITPAQKFVHLVDYLASRRVIDVNLGN